MLTVCLRGWRVGVEREDGVEAGEGGGGGAGRHQGTI